MRSLRKLMEIIRLINPYLICELVHNKPMFTVQLGGNILKRILVLILLCSIGMMQQINANTNQTGIKQVTVFYLTKQSVAVYDESGEVLGTIHNGHPYIYKEKSHNCYYIEVENHVGCVPASAIIEGTKMLHEEILDRSGKMVYTTQFTQIKDLKGDLLYTSHPNRRHFVFDKDENHYYVKLAGHLALLPKADTAIDKGIPVLMYHHIVKHAHPKENLPSTMITAEQFAQNINILQRQQARTITMNELYAFLQGKKNLGKNSVVITFDDGLKSNIIYAYPLLQQAKMKATNFVITSRVPTKVQQFEPQNIQYISSEEMANSTDVFQYEGHTHALHSIYNNKSLVILRSPSSVRSDLQKSQAIVQQRYFAYPFGQFNDTTKRLLYEMDYRLAFTTKHGYVTYGDDPYELKRIAIGPTTTENQFKQYIAY